MRKNSSMNFPLPYPSQHQHLSSYRKHISHILMSEDRKGGICILFPNMELLIIYLCHYSAWNICTYILINWLIDYQVEIQEVLLDEFLSLDKLWYRHPDKQNTDTQKPTHTDILTYRHPDTQIPRHSRQSDTHPYRHQTEIQTPQTFQIVDNEIHIHQDLS